MLTRERGREIQRLEKHHAFLTRMYLEVIDQRAQQIEQLNARIDAAMEPYTSIPAQRSCTTSMTKTSSTRPDRTSPARGGPRRSKSDARAHGNNPRFTWRPSAPC
jgi:hypothetical protein